ncbi:DUF4350 domain-containing protein [Cytophagaceae bacterium ABcell3]|nr:DUF4350 domain-containing protein [Cytophagaceae bacterium ABcell3]
MKKSFIYVVAAIVIGSLLFVLEWQKPDETNWNESYSQNDKIPFGNYVLYDLLEDIFPEASVVKVKKDLPGLYREILEPSNFIFISDQFNVFPSHFENLLTLVGEGSDVFVASHYFPDEIAERFGLETQANVVSVDKHGTPGNNFLRVLYGEKMSKVYNYKPGMLPFYFSKYGEGGEVIAVNHDNHPVVVRFPEGDGHVILCCVPKAFTNFNILYKDNHEFISRIFSFMPIRQVVWDEYYKPGNLAASSPIRVILNNRSLKMAYFTLLAAMVLYLFSELKRRQRVIPVVPPPTNSSIEFAETLGHLYFYYKNHKNLAEKRILYFMDKVKNMFHIPLKEKEDGVRDKLIRKQVAPKTLIDKLFAHISKVKGSDKVVENDLVILNSLIEEFEEEVKENIK